MSLGREKYFLYTMSENKNINIVCCSELFIMSKKQSQFAALIMNHCRIKHSNLIPAKSCQFVDIFI